MSNLPALPDREASLELKEVFDKAKKSFLDSLAAEEQVKFSECSSVYALLDEVKKFQVVAKAKQRGLRFAQKVQSLNNHLSPYFQIIEIFCGSNPEYANLVWGALRLVLQLASNFATFFEKLCETIRRLSLALPNFEDALRLLQSGSRALLSSRLRSSMTLFYTDLFEFFQAVARVFSDKKGKLKRTPLVIGDLLWKPFDSRFQDTLERMTFHRNLVKEEIQLGSTENLQRILHDQTKRAEDTGGKVLEMSSLVLDLSERFDVEHRRKFCASVLKWLEPPQFVTPFEQAQDAREQGTTEWLFEDSKFKTWRNCPKGGILWVQGNPGWGKTILAASTIEELRDSQASGLDSLPIVCYYFFFQNANQKASRVGAYRALVTQIFQQCHQLQEISDIFSIANDGVRTAASEHELLDLLKITLSYLSNVSFVFDSIDECKDNEKFVRDLCNIASSSHLKTILFSRPNVACLRRSIAEGQKIKMSREFLDKDITIFLDNELLTLQDSSLLPADLDMVATRDIILERAEGMFLWARLMMCYLKSPALSRGERMEEISKSTPEGLENMYLTIFDHIKSMDPASRQLASRVFMWVGYGKSYLNFDQIKEVTWGTQPGAHNANQLEDIDHGIIVSCCGLIEKRQNKFLHFIHLTAREFILSPRLLSDTGSSFVLLDKEAAFEMLKKCISYMMLSVPARPLGGDIHESLTLDELSAKFPFLKYATPYWAEHAKDIIPKISLESSLGLDGLAEVGKVVEEFTAAKLNLMVWIEATYIYRAFSSIRAIDDLAKAVLDFLEFSPSEMVPSIFQKLSKDLTDLAMYLEDMDSSWRSTLLRRPHEIWNDVTVFSPSRFFMSTSAASVAYMLSENSDDLGSSQIPLFSTSSNSVDGQVIAKLSIWPSRAFEEFWEKEKPAWDDVKGWNARYELFTLDGFAVPQSTLNLSLDAAEICLVLRQSLRAVLRRWTMSFPMLISRDLSTIIILRTVFQVRTGDVKERYWSAVVPLQSYNWLKSAPYLGYTYSYEWLIDSKSGFIVHHSIDRAPGSTPEPLSVFQIVKGVTFNINPVNTIHLFKKDPSDYTFCASHPQMAKLIFTACTSIWLVDLESRTEILKILELQPNGMRNSYSDTSVPFPDRRAPFQEGNIKEVGFSACGNYFTITYQNIEWPQIYPLPTTTLRLDSKNAPDLVETCTGFSSTSKNLNQNSLKRKTPEPSDHSDLQLSKMPKMVHTGSMVLSHHQISLNLSHQVAPQSIELVTQAQGSSTRVLSLARIPSHIDIEHTNSTVLWPENSKQPVQLIINAATKRSYDSDEVHGSLFLPAVVSRDLRSLGPLCEGNGAGRGVKWGTNGIGTGNVQRLEVIEAFGNSVMDRGF